jgi:plasmid stabilization system protein ParE
MARDLVWSPEALEDIESIASYIERDSAWYARAVASKIVEIAEQIPQFAELGRIVPEVADPVIRERMVYSYRIVYRLEAEQILIVAVIHGSRQLQPFMQRLEDAQP